MKKRVLIIEDSAAMRRLISLGLKRGPDVEIFEAADGLEALKILGQSRFDLAFVDINMPVMDGMKFLARLRGENLQPSMTVVVCTTEAGTDTEEAARAAGAHYYLRKPINRRDLDRVIDEVLKKRD